MCSAVVESRRIFRKLKAYVTYRFAATIQIVIVLTLLIYISNCTIDPMFIILLALFNDITMLPIAYDCQQASKHPENPDVLKMLTMSASFGLTETIMSMIFCYGADPSGLFYGEFGVADCDTQAQGAFWVQMFIAAELLIFVTRAPQLIVFSLAPSAPLTLSVLCGCLVVSLMAGCSDTFGGLQASDIVIIWVYDLVGLVILDCLKVCLLSYFNESTETLPDELVVARKGTGHGVGHAGHGVGHGSDTEQGKEMKEDEGEDFSRASMAAERLTSYSMQHGGERLSQARPSVAAGGAKKRTSSANMLAHHVAGDSTRMSLSHSAHVAAGNELRGSFVGGSIRPMTPANVRRK